MSPNNSPEEFEISSIREDGQVYFKGGTGQAPARYLEKALLLSQVSK